MISTCFALLEYYEHRSKFISRRLSRQNAVLAIRLINERSIEIKLSTDSSIEYFISSKIESEISMLNIAASHIFSQYIQQQTNIS